MPPLLQRLWPPLLLLLLLAAYFGPALAQGLLLAPNDGLAQYFPERVLAGESWKRGEVPFWNPFIFGGMPLLAAIQPGALFIGNWPFTVLAPIAAMNLTVILAYATAGIGTYAFARALTMPVAAAALSAVIFMWSGFMVGHLEHVVMVQAASLLPWLLWAIERYRVTLAPRYAQAGAIALALLGLAGHPQTAVFAGLLAAVYALWRGLGLKPRAWGAYLGHLSLLALVGAASTLPQLLPTWDLSREAARASLTYTELVSHSVPPYHLITLLFPFFFGSPPSGVFQTPYWGAGPFFNELTGYAGLLPLVLVLIAAAGLVKERQVRFWLVTAGVGLMLALGGFTPLYQAWAQIPVLDTMRIPGRHLLEFDFAVAILAGLGLARLLKANLKTRWRLAMVAWAGVGFALWAVVGLLVMRGPGLAARLQFMAPESVSLASALHPLQPNFWVPLAFWGLSGLALAGLANRAHGLWASMIVLLTAADLMLFGQFLGWRQQSPRPSAPFPVAAQDDARTLSIAASPYPYRDLPRVEALRYPVTGALWGTRAVTGYDPLFPARYGALMGKMSHVGHFQVAELFSAGHHGLSILGTRHLRLDRALLDDPTWQWRMAEGRFTPVREEDGVGLFEDKNALPRAWRVVSVNALTPEAIAGRVTEDPSFVPGAEALVEAPIALAPPSWSPGETTLEPVGLNRLRLTTRGEGPGFVVVNEGYDPGWRAFAGPREFKVHRVDGLVLGLEVPAGAWLIDLRYEPRTWRFGLLGAGLGLLVLLIWAIAGWKAGTPKKKVAR